MRNNVLAAIANSEGVVVRVVVTPLPDLHHHIGVGERVWIVPDLLVDDPLPYEQWGLVEAARAHGNEFFKTAKSNAPCPRFS